MFNFYIKRHNVRNFGDHYFLNPVGIANLWQVRDLQNLSYLLAEMESKSKAESQKPKGEKFSPKKQKLEWVKK